MILGYGCNAIEAWAMGIPVVAGADSWTLARMRQEFGRSGLPFYEATAETIRVALRELVLSADLRAKWDDRGLRHARRFHAEKPALERALELYAEAIKVMDGWRRNSRIALEGAPEGRTGPGVFHSDTYRSLMVHYQGARLKFIAGRLAATDPYEAEIIREFALIQPIYGIYEEEAPS